MSSFNAQLIDELRANEGKAGGMFADRDLIILTTTGARSGLARESPLVYVMDGTRFLIVGSNGGSDLHPSWYYNLLAQPRARAEVDGAAFEVDATILEGSERDEAFDVVVVSYPFFAEYRESISRIIPVIALTQVS